MMNNFDKLADKAISDEELEQVSGGAAFQWCMGCGQQCFDLSATVCPNCGKPF